MSLPHGHIQGVRLLALAAFASLPGCALLAPNHAVHLSTNPPGATVLLDGRNIGFVTPCVIQLDVDEDARLDFAVPGFRPETRFLTPDDEVYSILWREMNVGPQTWNFPLWLPMRDFLVPLKWMEGHSPGRVHIDLDRLSDEAPKAAAPVATAAPARAAPGRAQ
ncbi:MAG: PEGA domain-containing protein [Planctomycetota bacterium]|nr:PEGA domain-containing protein [Planctomycetota bacterium]